MNHRIVDVVERGMCIGCGACSVRTSGAIPVALGRYGQYSARLDGVPADQLDAASRVCPFSDAASNEDVLAAERFRGMEHDRAIGHYQGVHAGRVVGDDELVRSSSGGLTTWTLVRAMRSGLIDGVLHVGTSQNQNSMYEYIISTTPEDVASHRKSQYYATTMKDVLTHIQGDGKRYAVVGVPCFIKAARLLSNEMPELGDQLALFIGIVCGHLKSQFFSESLAWQAGIKPGELASLDFRVKNPNRAASAYDYEATSDKGKRRRRSTAEAIDGSWGYGAFQPEACNFCDDVFAETADVVFGDAWLPKFTPDWRGTNVVVTRNQDIEDLLQEGMSKRSIDLEPLSPVEAGASQAGNFRHRRDGLRVRLADDIREGLSVPRKRVEPGYDHTTGRRVELYRQRRRMSRLSLIDFAAAKAEGRLATYVRPMKREIRRYRRVEHAFVRRNYLGLRAMAGRFRNRTMRLLGR